MQDFDGLMNRRDSERDWLDNLMQIYAGKFEQKQVKASNLRLAKYADFVCTSCSKMFTKKAAIDDLQGYCDNCDNELSATAELQEQAKQKDEANFECVKCGSLRKKTDCQKSKCACGSGSFVSQRLMLTVCENTRGYLTAKGLNVDDVWHEKGNVFVAVSGAHENGAQWKTVVAATGKFTENDVVMYEWAPNENGGEGLVATAQSNKLIPFKPNPQCTVEWSVEDDFVEPEAVALADVNGQEIRVGSRLAWYQSSGVTKADVVSATNDGRLICGITQDEMGRAKAGNYHGEVSLNQEDIINLQAFVD